MRKSALAIILLVACNLQAQQLSMKNMIKLGLSGGVAFSDNSKGNFGLDVSYQNMVTPHVGLGISTGYSQHFSKEYEDVTFKDYGIIPFAGMVKYYFKSEGLYIGTDVGYSLISGPNKMTEEHEIDMPAGGFYLKPEIGYHNRNWNVYIHYAKTFLSDTYEVNGKKFQVGTLGVGFAYNIPLGK